MLYKCVTNIFIAFFSLLGIAVATAQEDTSRNSLEYQRDMYKQYKHIEFDLGGEASRFAWREMPGLFPQATINHHKRVL
jgi:hypothetical protein